jgi:hypothetical protein
MVIGNILETGENWWKMKRKQCVLCDKDMMNDSGEKSIKAYLAKP